MIKTHQRGFTLIELVVVIVILGILAAFAVPRFMGMEGEARAATLRSFGGSLRAAAAMARGKCQAQNCGLSGNVTVDGTAVTMVNGYPSAASIAATVDLTSAGFGTPTPQGTPVTGMRFTNTGGGTNCWVQYTQAASVAAPPTISYFSTAAGTVSLNCGG
jgi:MSHA pilin protein MshA